MPGAGLVSIRQLGRADAALMPAVLRMFGAAFEDMATYTGAAPGRDYLVRLLDSESFIAVAATKSDTVVGGIAAYALQKFEQARSEIYIYDLAVSVQHRRQGIATAMIRELQRIAAVRGAWVVYVQADLGDEPAIALYSKLGIREEVAHFDLPVREAAAP